MWKKNQDIQSINNVVTYEFKIMFLILIFTLLFVLWVKFKADNRIVRLSSDIPGPPTLPLIGNVHLVPPNGKDGLNLRARLIKEYGNVVRIWIGSLLIVFLSDPKDCEVVLRDTNELTKSNIYNFLHSWLGLGLLTSTGEKWRHRRKALTPAFHFTILEQFIDVFNKNGRILVECLEGFDHNGSDIQPFISRYALDVICETAMGTQINAQKNVHSPYVKAVRKMCNLISGRIRKPWIYPNFLWSLLGYKKIEDELLATLNSITNEVLKENENNQEEYSEDNDLGLKKKTAFLKLLLKMKKEGSNTFKTDSDIREEVNTFMFEGHDTTTASICFTLSLLVKHPHIQELIHDELKTMTTKTSNFTHEDLNEMKYLERVIKESLRLFPSVPVIDRKLDKDMKIPSGYTIPAGSLVAVSIFFAHRNINYYDKPNQFDPDNFLPEITSKRHPYSYIPFSAGPRNCIGQKFAMMELKSVLAKLILNYKFEPMEDKWDVQLNPDIVLQSMNGHWMKIKKRC